jgi:GT2 family glycosyltransferase
MNPGASPSQPESAKAVFAFWVDRLFFDDARYLTEYPEVLRAVEAGAVASGYDHFHRYGKWEGRTYPLRKRFFGSVLLLVALFLEAAFRRTSAFLNPFELWPRLRDGQHPLKLRGGPKTLEGFRAGPWTCSLLPWQVRRRVLVELALDSRASVVRCTLQPLDGAGHPLGDPSAIDCYVGRRTKRVIAFPTGTRGLRLTCTRDDIPVRPLHVLVKPLSNERARTLIRRRVERDGAKLPARVSMKDLWPAYEATFPLAQGPTYAQWVRRTEAPLLVALDSRCAAAIEAFPERPLVSVLVPTWNPPEAALRACLDSVLAQSYPHWELCVVDDASTAPHVRTVLEEYQERDGRVRVQFRAENGHISRASQDALEMAKGRFIALLDHDDELSRHALFSMMEAVFQHPRAVVFYSDEDKLDQAGERCRPHFKPRFDPDRLLGQNYIAHFLFADREATLAAGGFRVGYEGSQDHDLVLRLTRGLDPSRVVHVPSVLYHWRESPQSTAALNDAKPYALQAGLRAVQDALAATRRGATVAIDERGKCYRVTWDLPDPPPRVSIIVPTRDAVELLSQCISSVLEKTDYPDYEIIIVDNQSRHEKTRRYFEDVTDDPRVRVVSYDHPFNYSALNNFAARRASGSLLCLLNNDIEVKEGTWLREMVSLAVRPDTGCVGAKLLYPDGRIQHAGVVLGIGGVAGHAFKYGPGDSLGYFSKLRVAHTVSAVTAACLVVRKKVFEQVGGLDEVGLRVAFNDVDFCIKVRDAGYRNVLTPHAVLVHHESATRGSDNDESRRERFAGEQRVMKQRWGNALKTDPYYSPHLTLEREDFGL